MAENNNSNRKLSSFRQTIEDKRNEFGVDDRAEAVLNILPWVELFGSFTIGFVSLLTPGHDAPFSTFESIVLIVGGVIIWSLVQVIINISRSLKHINNGIKVFFLIDLDDLDKPNKEKDNTEPE